MSMRHRATQCLGKISDKPRSRASNPASPLWPGYHVRSHEHEVSQPSSPAPSVASERLSRSRETVKAWLESSPTSVLGDHLVVGSRTSSSHSHVSSPGRPECRACSSPFDRSRSNNILPRVSCTFLLYRFRHFPQWESVFFEPLEFGRLSDPSVIVLVLTSVCSEKID